jgi:hypothetical protein
VIDQSLDVCAWFDLDLPNLSEVNLGVQLCLVHRRRGARER